MITHFVGFRKDEYTAACKAFGEPDFIHQIWDRRAESMVAEGDRVIFANAADTKPMTKYNFDDSEIF
jgi:hypothetical protein